MEHVKTYLEPKTMAKYDATRIIGYLHEEVIEGYIPENEDGETPEPVTAYRYTGTERDGELWRGDQCHHPYPLHRERGDGRPPSPCQQPWHSVRGVAAVQ